MTRPWFFQRLLRRLVKTISSAFFLDQWVIMTGISARYDSLQWSGFRSLVPEKDRYWADPFPLEREDGYYVFLEEKLYATGLGRIACLKLDRNGDLLSNQVALDRPYHLSYPFLLERSGEIYMIPETAGNRTIELYRCAQFPDRWEFVKTLMVNIYAVDTTLLEHDHKWWLFANLKEPGGSSLDALHLFCADSPFAEKWTPHPRNPVVRDIRSARPAGRIFEQDGKLIRPSQDSSQRYGHALKFNRITMLNEDEYEEAPDAEFRPRGRGLLATHTFNQAGKLTVIDAVVRRNRF
jgi:hypothetical protein